jgi:hypothetical protein
MVSSKDGQTVVQVASYDMAIVENSIVARHVSGSHLPLCWLSALGADALWQLCPVVVSHDKTVLPSLRGFLTLGLSTPSPQTSQCGLGQQSTWFRSVRSADWQYYAQRGSVSLGCKASAPSRCQVAEDVGKMAVNDRVPRLQSRASIRPHGQSTLNFSTIQ